MFARVALLFCVKFVRAADCTHFLRGMSVWAAPQISLYLQKNAHGCLLCRAAQGDNMTNREKLEAAAQRCAACEGCTLCKTSTHLVYGTGNPEASLVFVGEAPGEKEDLAGIPFVGPAGQLFDLYLDAVGLHREQVYICNILKCRPPHNRDPLPEEMSACMEHLREQIKIIAPKLIVCLGRIAAGQLIKPDFKVTREHGVFFEKGQFTLCGIYHPSALLRDPSKREDMYRDMKQIAQRYRQL